MDIQNIQELVKKSEEDFKQPTQISKYVQFSISDTLERIDAYLNSKHISGETDSLGREKPFFNIGIAAANIWYRATDIDRSNIQIKAAKEKDYINSFLATIHLRAWMRREMFGQFLNEWGRTLARYGSAVIKFVRTFNNLHISVTPWNRLIIDAVDFEDNPKIEIIELTEAQLRKRVQTHKYNSDEVDSLCNSLKARETKSGLKKDNKNNYIKIYELHGNLPLSYLTDKETDKDIYVQQMHVVSFITSVRGKIKERFSLYKGKEKKDPYMITHLIKEDGRVLSIGAIEHLFEPQWMVNHSMKSIKDSLDLASKTIYQTADPGFVGRNILDNLQSGDILIHALNQPLTQLNNTPLNIVPQQNFSLQWKQLGNEITGVSESMMGATPKSGTAWRQTEAILQESHSLFELMTENKGLYIEQMLREWIIPYLKTKMDTAEEVSATLEQYELDAIDGVYIKNTAIKLTNTEIKEKILNGELITEEDKMAIMAEKEQKIKDSLTKMGNQRFFKPSEVDWKEQFKDFEWDAEVNITGEAVNYQSALATLNTALKAILIPGFQENKKAQMVVGKILELTGTLSPLEYNAAESINNTPEISANIGGNANNPGSAGGVGELTKDLTNK